MSTTTSARRLLQSINPQDWFPLALCRQRAWPDLWFPSERGLRGRPRIQMETRAAIAICEDCPVRVQCFRYSVRHRIKDGIWGGLTGSQRRRYWR